MDFSGERYLPEVTGFQISYEHWHRYLYATHFSAGKTVLDIACGEGYGSALLAENAKKVTGVDIDEEVVRHAARKYKKANLNFLKGSVSEIPVKGKAIFDLIVSFETIEHVGTAEQAAFMEEVRRLLKPGGLFIASTPDKRIYSDLSKYKNQFHIKEFYPHEFSDFLLGYFRHVEILGQDIYTSSYIRPHANNALLQEFNLGYNHDFRPQPTPSDPQDAYMLAFCAEKQLNPLPPSLLFNTQNKRAKYDYSYQVLYIDRGAGFNESESLLGKLEEGSPSITFDLSGYSGIQKLRFDPAACPVLVEIQGVRIITAEYKQKSVLWTTNAVRQDGHLCLFDSDDPQVFLNGPFPDGLSSIVIELKFIALGNDVYPYLKTNIAEQLSEMMDYQAKLKTEIRMLQNQVNILEEEMRQSTMFLQKAEDQLVLQKRALEKNQQELAYQQEYISRAATDIAEKDAIIAHKNQQLSDLGEQLAFHIKQAEITLINLREKEGLVFNLTDRLNNSLSTVAKLEASLDLVNDRLRSQDEKMHLLLQSLDTSLRTTETLRLELYQKQEAIREQQIKLVKRSKKLKALMELTEQLDQEKNDLMYRLSAIVEEKAFTEQNVESAQEHSHTHAANWQQVNHLNQLIAHLEIELLKSTENLDGLWQDNQRKTQYIGELKQSLSFRLGWFLTAPFRWVYEGLRVPFWSKFFTTAVSHPAGFFKNFNAEKITILIKALKNEPPSLILANFNKLLSGSNNELSVTPAVQAPARLQEAPAREENWEEEALTTSMEGKIHFHVDQLAELDFHVLIRGWLFAELHKIKSLALQMIQGEQQQTVELFYPLDRVDVFNHFNFKNAVLSGFTDQVEKTLTGEVYLSFIITFADGNTSKIEIGKTRFSKPSLYNLPKAIRANRAAFYHKSNSKKISQRSIALYTNSEGNYFFNEIKALLAQGFRSLNFNVLNLNEKDGFQNNALLHVVVAPHEFFALGRGVTYTKKPSDRLVLLNTEQPSSQWFRKGTEYFHYALEVWDMNFYSFQCLKETIQYARFLPLGYVNNLAILSEVRQLPENYCTCFLDNETRNKSYLNSRFEDRPIDILFIGHASPRRQQFFAKYAVFFARYNCYFHLTDLSSGPVLESKNNMNTRTAIGLAQRSKIILNIHHGTQHYFEWHRMIMHGVWQRGLVISDLCSEGPPFEQGKHFIQAPLDQLPEKISYFLDTEQGRKSANEIIEQAFQTLTNQCDLTAILKDLTRPFISKTGIKDGN